MFLRFVAGFLVVGSLFAAVPVPVPCSVQIFVGDSDFTGGVDAAFYQPGRPLNQTRVNGPRRMLSDSQRRLYFFREPANAIYRTTLDGKTEVVAGGGTIPGATGVLATQAQFGIVRDMAIDAEDRLYFSAIANPTGIFRLEDSGQLTVVAGGGNYYDWQSFGERQGTDINFQARPPVLGVTPAGTLYFYWSGAIFEMDHNGMPRVVQSPNGAPLSLASDSEGRLMVGDFDGLFVYDDPQGQPSRALGVSATDAAETKGAYFAMYSPNSVARVTAGGRTTDLFPFGSAFVFDNGSLGFNSGLVAPSAIATNSAGDLFIADAFLDRIFVMHNADSCLSERPYIGAIVNGASFNTAGFSPGELVSVFGDYLGLNALSYGAPGESDQGTWQDKVGGVEILVNGYRAPIIFSRSDQTAFVIPNEVSGEAKVQVHRNGFISGVWTRDAANASPGLFTVNTSGGGQAAALNQDSSINSPQNPAAAGSVIVLYLTGAGATIPPSVTGSLNDFPLPQLQHQVEVLINYADAVVEFAGPAPGLVSGVVQVNARIPADMPSGAVPVNVRIGGIISPSSPANQPVTISIQ